jgi:hypothetical protein
MTLMATSSADPDDLGTFVTDAGKARSELSTAVIGVRFFYDQVVPHFGSQYGLSHPDLWVQVDNHLRDTDLRDRFVGTVRDAFVAADRSDPVTNTGQGLV